MATILTGSWSTKLPPGATAVGISRGTPRGLRGFNRLRLLEPGTWFRSVPPRKFLTLYRQILDGLDPAAVQDRLVGYGDMPVMLCWESPADCHAGRRWCHRHLVAQWLEDRLGIEVHEVNHPTLERFALLRRIGVEPPNFGTEDTT